MTINKIIYSILLLGCFTLQAQVKVGNNPATINATAAFEVESTTKGFLPPRMTTGERDLIASPARGLVLYNTSLDCLQINKGTAASPNWECIGASAAPTLVTDCNASRFALSSPAQDPLCNNGLFIGTSGYQVKFVLTNNSLSAVSGLDLSTAVSLTGAGSAGLTVTTGQNTNVSVNSAASVAVTYNFTGSPTTAGSITATFSKLGLTCTITNNVINMSTWAGNGLDGTTAPNANYSCLAIKNAFPASADGAYWVDPDGSCTTYSPMQAYCDMTTDGGGWALVGQYNFPAGSYPSASWNSNLSSFRNLGSNTIGNESASTGSFGTWGLISETFANALQISSYRIESKDVARTINFKSPNVNFLRGGTASATGLTDLPSSSGFTGLTKLSIIPGGVLSAYTLRGPNQLQLHHSVQHTQTSINNDFIVARLSNNTNDTQPVIHGYTITGNGSSISQGGIIRVWVR